MLFYAVHMRSEMFLEAKWVSRRVKVNEFHRDSAWGKHPIQFRQAGSVPAQPTIRFAVFLKPLG